MVTGYQGNPQSQQFQQLQQQQNQANEPMDAPQQVYLEALFQQAQNQFSSFTKAQASQLIDILQQVTGRTVWNAIQQQPPQQQSQQQQNQNQS